MNNARGGWSFDRAQGVWRFGRWVAQRDGKRWSLWWMVNREAKLSTAKKVSEHFQSLQHIIDEIASCGKHDKAVREIVTKEGWK